MGVGIGVEVKLRTFGAIAQPLSSTLTFILGKIQGVENDPGHSGSRKYP